MTAPDYISPVVGYRIWNWDAAGLKSLNGELWLAGQSLAAVCKADNSGSIAGLSKATHDPADLPYFKCTCGVYAAKAIEHLHRCGYKQFGVHGEVYLWGVVVEHERGWRAQYAYPKRFFLVPNTLPLSLSQIDARLQSLIAFGTDIFVIRDQERVPLWKNGSGYEAAGLDYLIKRRKEYYVRRVSERTLRKGDRVALLGLGIAVVERVADQDVLLTQGNRQTVRVARRDITLNEQNTRWECAVKAR